MILVVGATGRLGGAITKMLLAQGKDVRILVRHNSPSVEMSKIGMATSADELIGMGAQPVYGDLKDRASLDAEVQGVDVVISTANSVLRGGEDNVQTVDGQGNLNLIDAATNAGVKQFIFVNGGPMSDPNSPLPFFAAKGKAQAACMASGMRYTILSPNAFMEVWPAMVVGMPLMKGFPIKLVGEARNKTDFISMRDVAAYTVNSIDNDAAQNQMMLLGGPEALSYRDVVNVFERVMGREIPITFAKPGEPIEYLPDEMVGILAAMQEDLIIGDHGWSKKLNVTPTTLEQVVRGMMNA